MKAPIFRFWDLLSGTYLNPDNTDICNGEIFTYADTLDHLNIAQLNITKTTIPELQSSYPDRNNLLITEGDFVRLVDKTLGYIVFDNGAFYLNSIEECILLSKSHYSLEIIGNIHQDSYLISLNGDKICISVKHAE